MAYLFHRLKYLALDKKQLYEESKELKQPLRNWGTTPTVGGMLSVQA